MENGFYDVFASYLADLKSNRLIIAHFCEMFYVKHKICEYMSYNSLFWLLKNIILNSQCVPDFFNIVIDMFIDIFTGVSRFVN